MSKHFYRDLHERLCVALGVVDAKKLEECDTRDLFEIYDGLLSLLGNRQEVRKWLREPAKEPALNGKTPLKWLESGQSNLIRGYVEILCGRT